METFTKTLCGLEVRVGLFGKQDAKRTVLFFNGIGARLEAVPGLELLAGRRR